MRMIKPAAIAVIGLTTILLLTACGPSNSANDPTSNTKTQQVTATSTPTVDQREVVATTMQNFYNHLFNYPVATENKVAAAVPGGLKFGTDAPTFTEAQAVKIKAAMEQADPYFTYIDTRKQTAVKAVATYEGLEYVTLFFEGKEYSLRVDATKIQINGTTATVPASALTVYQHGKPYKSTNGGLNISSGTGGQLHLVNGKWLIDTDSANGSSASTTTK